MTKLEKILKILDGSNISPDQLIVKYELTDETEDGGGDYPKNIEMAFHMLVSLGHKTELKHKRLIIDLK